MSGRVGDASPAARGTGAPIVAVRGSATAGGLRLQRLVHTKERWRARASELRRIAAKRGIYWLIDHQPHRPERGLLGSLATTRPARRSTPTAQSEQWWCAPPGAVGEMAP
jgi:hypothetical protein